MKQYSKSTSKKLDWPAVIAAEARLGPLLRPREIAQKYQSTIHNTNVNFQRLESRGFVEKVKDGIYLNRLTPNCDPRDLVNALEPHSYVSLESALAEWGVTSQNPLGLLCVTSIQPPREYKTSLANVLLRYIKHTLFRGFIKRKTRYSTYYIAEPEKALLDLIYFRLRDGLPIALDEFNLRKLKRSQIALYVGEYPSTVLKALSSDLLTRTFAD